LGLLPLKFTSVGWTAPYLQRNKSQKSDRYKQLKEVSIMTKLAKSVSYWVTGCLATLVMTASSAVAANPEQVQELITTGQCPGCDLAGADLIGAHLIGADLRNANLTGANLSHANLEGADLTGANLTRANLTKTYLTNASMAKATLSHADMTSAIAYNADISRAVLDNITIVNAELFGTPINVGSDTDE
jgi:uncharacterized protein YjbI with pentapeptide repeats